MPGLGESVKKQAAAAVASVALAVGMGLSLPDKAAAADLAVGAQVFNGNCGEISRIKCEWHRSPTPPRYVASAFC